jgi:hypothetical protein
MNEYELKQEAKRERLEAAASRASAESDAYHRSSRDAVAGIPFGQPILVGHHSEGRHRRAVDKSWNHLGKAVEADKRAQELARRAAAIGTGGISSDDPDAVTKLRAELAEKVASRDMMKGLNKGYRLAVKRGLAREDVTNEDLVDLLFAVGGIEINDQAIAAMRRAVTWKPEYSFQKGPFEGYSLQNIGANIRRIEGRIADLEARAKVREALEAEAPNGVATSETVIGAVRIVENVSENRLQMFFPGKPSYEVRAALKGRGFRWSPTAGAWQRHLTGNAKWAAEEIANTLNKGAA